MLSPYDLPPELLVFHSLLLPPAGIPIFGDWKTRLPRKQFPDPGREDPVQLTSLWNTLLELTALLPVPETFLRPETLPEWDSCFSFFVLLNRACLFLKSHFNFLLYFPLSFQNHTHVLLRADFVDL